MKVRILSAAAGLGLVVAVAASGQNPGSTGSTPTARIDPEPVQLIMPERYQVPLVLQASRQVWVAAPADGLVQGTATIGKSVKADEEVAQLDRAEASARLKIAEANVKEAQAQLDEAKDKPGGSKSAVAVAEARLDAAKARVDLAQLDLKRCTLKAPFAGRVLDVRLWSGSFVPKGGAIAQVADVSSLNVTVPIERNSLKAGDPIDLTTFEGKAVRGKVQAMLPLGEYYAVLRELVTPWAAAWVSVPNGSGELEPGQRVKMPALPAEPIATVARRAVDRAGGKAVQVLRQGYVFDVPVQVLGPVGTERLQVAGAFRPYDSVINESSQNMIAGTFVNLNDPNNPSFNPPVGGPSATPGTSAPPTRTGPYGGNSRVAGIGAQDSNVPAGGNAPKAKASRPPQPAAQPKAQPKGNRPAGSVVPF